MTLKLIQLSICFNTGAQKFKTKHTHILKIASVQFFFLFPFNGGGGCGGGDLDCLYFTAILHHFHIWMAINVVMECQNVLLYLWLGQS